MNGKGDTPRPVDKAKYDANYEHIFGSEEVVRARRQLFMVQRQLEKVNLETNMTIETPNHAEDLAFFERQIVKALGIPQRVFDSYKKRATQVIQESKPDVELDALVSALPNNTPHRRHFHLNSAV